MRRVGAYDPALEGPLRRIARRMLRDEADQDDVVQEAWLASLTSDVRPDHPGRWMASVLRHRVLKVWERRQRGTDAESQLEPPEPPADPAREADRRVVRELLVDALDQLPPAHALVLRRHYFDGLTLADVARETGRPMGTVKTHLARGLSELRLRLDQRLGDRRALALLLVRGFEWAPGDLATTSAAGASAAALPATATVARAVVGGLALALVAALGTWLVHGWSGPGAAPRAVAPTVVASGEVVPAPAGPAPRRTPVPPSVPPSGGAAEPAFTSAGTTPHEASPNPAAPSIPADVMRVTFVVVAPDGTPAADARAWLDQPGAPREDADAEGRIRFEVRREDVALDVDRESLRFRFEVPGHARTPGVRVPLALGSERVETLALALPARALTVRVEDAGGRPVAGARVTAGSDVHLREDDLEFDLAASDGATGADGRVRFVDLEASRVTVSAHAGEGSAHGTVDLAAGTVTEVRLALGSADPDAARARFEAALAERGAGRQRVARAPRRTYRVRHDELRAAPAPALGGELLPDGQPLHLEVLDPSGAPWVGLPVRVTRDDAAAFPAWTGVARTDAAGRATLPSVPRADVRVALHAPLPSGDAAALPFHVRRAVRGGDAPVRIVADRAPLGSVRARVTDADGRPCDRLVLVVSGPRAPAVATLPVEGSAFEVPGLAPGRTTLALGDGRRGFTTFTAEVESGRVRDLGTLRLPAPGRLRIASRWKEGATEDDRRLDFEVFSVLPGDAGPVPLAWYAAQGAPPAELEVLPGRVLVRVSGADGTLLQWRATDVHGGGTSEVLLDAALPIGDPGPWPADGGR